MTRDRAMIVMGVMLPTMTQRKKCVKINIGTYKDKSAQKIVTQRTRKEKSRTRKYIRQETKAAGDVYRLLFI
jgi:hypothetical protein